MIGLSRQLPGQLGGILCSLRRLHSQLCTLTAGQASTVVKDIAIVVTVVYCDAPRSCGSLSANLELRSILITDTNEQFVGQCLGIRISYRTQDLGTHTS
jgi:hypothetical protein